MLSVSKFAAAAGLCVSLAVGIAACGSSSKSSSGGSASGGGSSSGGKSLTIYSSLPQQAADRQQSLDVISGEQLALSQVGNKVGTFSIKFVSLDDATAAAGQWDPTQASSNARRAAQDPSTIGYVGEFNSGASAITIPILNGAGILQVSPANTAIPLTQVNSGFPGAPQKYYPSLASNGRTYGRVVPVDSYQANADLEVMKGLGIKKLYILDDTQVYGLGIAKAVQQYAPKYGIAVAGEESIDTKATNYRSLAQKIKSSGADALFFGGLTVDGGPQLWNDISAVNPTLKKFGPDGVDEDSFSTKISPAAQANTWLSVPQAAPNAASKKFLADFQAAYHHTPQPYAIDGYEAMSVILDSIKRAGAQGNNRADVVKAFHATTNKASVLGTYSIDANGDTSLATYEFSTIKGGKRIPYKFVKAVLAS
jgi:branched-chain amino acid transport system substrate-binding protein